MNVAVTPPPPAAADARRRIVLDSAADLDADAYDAIVGGRAAVSVSAAAQQRVGESRAAFLAHIETGVICYGVTTGLGAMSATDLTAAQRALLPRQTMIGRASGTGPPLPRGVGRGALMAKLAQFLGGRSGVSWPLCASIVEQLNAGIDPVVPSRGYGMAGEIIALAHATLPLIGLGAVHGAVDDSVHVDRRVLDAAQWHEQHATAPYEPQPKEGLSLINGTAVSPALAWHVAGIAAATVATAHVVAAASIEGLAAPFEAYSADAASESPDPNVATVMTILRDHLARSTVTRHDRQAPVSYRVTPQVHAVTATAIEQVRAAALAELRSNGDNPLFILDPASPGGGRLVNSGNFHGAALTAAVEAATVAMVHAGVLSEKRLYRLLDERASGLSRQLAHDPGLDAGAITIHKAALGYVAELKALAAPVSVMQADSSFGQEDEQSLIFPALDRLAAAVDVVGAILAHELYVAAMAIDARGERPSPTVAALHAVVRSVVPRYAGDRSYGPELDRVIELVRTRVRSTATTA